jgi:hypothetical protein
MLVQAATLKLADTDKTFYSGCKELHNASIAWAHFMNIFRTGF